MKTCLKRSAGHQGRVSDKPELPHEVRLDDPSIKALPVDQSKAVILDIRGTSIVELPQGAEFLHLRTDYFIWSPKSRTFMFEMDIPESVFATMQGRRVRDLIEHPILKQLGIDERYFNEVRKTDKYVISSLVKRRPR